VSSGLPQLIHPVLASLRDEHGEAAVQAVPADVSMVYIAFFPSVHPIAVRERPGLTVGLDALIGD